MLLPAINKNCELVINKRNVPCHFKQATVRPKLKKDSLDHELFPNFTPILSKVTKRAAACQLIDYLHTNARQEMFQSAYKVIHSTKTALALESTV